jgi:hypothetical protein
MVEGLPFARSPFPLSRAMPRAPNMQRAGPQFRMRREKVVRHASAGATFIRAGALNWWFLPAAAPLSEMLL